MRRRYRRCSSSAGRKVVTSALLDRDGKGDNQLATVIVRADGIELIPQIHDAGALHGSGQPLRLVRLKHGLAAIVTGIDSLFPETGTTAAKNGADFLVVTSELGGRGLESVAFKTVEDSLPRGWGWDSLVAHWRAMANGCMHVLAADMSAYALAEARGAYCSPSRSATAFMTNSLVEIDSTSQRQKNLNWYYDFGIEALLTKR